MLFMHSCTISKHSFHSRSCKLEFKSKYLFPYSRCSFPSHLSSQSRRRLGSAQLQSKLLPPKLYSLAQAAKLLVKLQGLALLALLHFPHCFVKP
ncbi:hypothetical protein BCR44DRAFT_46564 [Catenaria anguillulae PL171]|uniref:Uncharacterized protein n=1 Tax=Catenaria anguillulae PL171 TaxID=765915 RepID=A0A1Y2HX56_9FUNG|nr:hypothetical protein BCR44DRAFT_1432892 [Catenaria anguillulae PL171]ORZ39178.1 hypothetical protein BCR44DRAFT_46564 [Catenaria anguillulae PL171]